MIRLIVYFFCVVIIGLGTIAAINLIQIFTAESRVYGTPRFEREYTREIVSHDIGVLVFVQQDGIWTHTARISSVDFDGARNNYAMTVNGYFARIINQSAGLLTAEFDISFRDVYGNTASRVQLNFRWEFTITQTNLTITTSAMQNQLGYLNQFVHVHGFNVSVIDRQTKGAFL